MSYYKANRLREAAKWTRRLGYALLPVIIIAGMGASQGAPEGEQYLLRIAIVGGLMLAITEGIGFMLEKSADRMAKN